MDWEFDSSSDPDAVDFWSPEVVGQSVRVQVFSKVPNSALRLVIDKRIEYLEPIREKSIVGNDDTIEITKATLSKYKKWGRSVARLMFVSDEEEDEKVFYTCTGFLVAPDLFMTNDHCPRSEKEIRSSVVEFDYDSEFARTKMYRLKREILRDEDLDFALYRLNKSVTDRTFLKLKDDDQNLENNRPLLIIQHPGGRPKRLAAFNCWVKTSEESIEPPSDFGHECDTEGGSSGSPVQTIEGLVIGLHHYGFPTPPALQINQAIRMGAILKFIEKKDGTLFKSLTRR
jgi:V8-like Glu-specific endopeptidase